MRSQKFSFAVILIATAVFTVGCGKETETKTVTVEVPGPQSTTTILLQRSTNSTSVTLNDLSEGSVHLANGAYLFECDVNYTTSTSTVSQVADSGPGLVVGSVQSLAQSFLATETGKLKSVSVKVHTDTQVDVGLYVYQTLPAGGAIGSPLVSETLTVPVGTQWLTVNLATPLDVTKNTTYYLVLKSSSSTWADWITRPAAVDTYADGKLYAANSGNGYNYGNTNSDAVFSLDIDYQHSPSFQYFYNGVASSLYTTYPAGQDIAIDGGAAGVLKFTPLSSAPVTNVSDGVSVLVQ